jgi:hypothetical protein
MIFREDFLSAQSVASNGGIVTGSPRINRGLVFTENNTQYIKYYGGPTLCGTVAATFRFSLRTPSDVTNVHQILTKYTSASPCFEIQSVIDQLRVYFYAGTNYARCPILASTSYLIHVVYDGSQSGNAARLKVYFDSVAQSLTFTGTIPSSLTPSSAPLAIGAAQSVQGRAGAWHKSTMIYNRAFTDGDVREDYLEAKT